MADIATRRAVYEVRRVQQEVLQFWMPGYVAGIALCACFACAGVYVSDPHHRFRVLLAAVGAGAFYGAVRFIWP